MKQRGFFESKIQDNSLRQTNRRYWQLFVDGAARNNPGPAGAGIVILKDNAIIEQHGFFIGNKTNNQAEYLALLLGLVRVKKLIAQEDLLLINSDSELLVRQLKGIYRVKSPDIYPLFDAACSFLADIKYDIKHVLRSKNKRADSLANQGIDRKIHVPNYVLKVLHEHNISL